jgi:hypothetical protein
VKDDILAGAPPFALPPQHEAAALPIHSRLLEPQPPIGPDPSLPPPTSAVAEGYGASRPGA